MKKLPVIGTTAPTTTYCAQRIEGPRETYLYVDGNQKITAGNGSYDAPLPNAFSLEAQAVVNREQPLDLMGWVHADCPGSTPTCRKSCYVHGLEKHAHDTYELYRHNSAEIRRILIEPELADAWVLIFAEWITANAPGGFRWHVSGDVFSPEYAEWIADVCRESPKVRHWIYTRTFEYYALNALAQVSTLRGGNLALNLSCDKDNYQRAAHAALMCGGTEPMFDDAGNRIGEAYIPGKYPLRLCYLVEKDDPFVPADLPPGSVIFPDYDLRPKSAENPQDHAFWNALTVDQRGMLCPVDSYGKSEKIRCGLERCDRCLK